MKLRPVTFLYKPEYDKGPRSLQYGLIAAEVAEIYPDLVAYDPDGKPYTVKYQYLTTMLLNEVQKQYPPSRGRGEGHHGSRRSDRGSAAADRVIAATSGTFRVTDGNSLDNQSRITVAGAGANLGRFAVGAWRRCDTEPLAKVRESPNTVWPG